MRPWLKALVVLVWMVGCRPAAGPHPPTRAEVERFRDSVLEVLRAEYPGRRFEATDDPWVLRSRDLSLGLQGLYARSQLGSSGTVDRRALIKSQFDSLLADPHDGPVPSILSWETARPLLMPQLLPAAAFETVHGPHRPFCDGVVQAYVVDSGMHDRVVTRDDLAGWKVNAKTIEETALANLEARSSGMKLNSSDGEDPFIIVALGDGYDAARILLPGFRRYAAQRLGEPFLAGVPNRDFLIAWSFRCLPEFQGRTRRAIIEDFSSQAHPLSQAVLQVSNAGITPVD